MSHLAMAHASDAAREVLAACQGGTQIAQRRFLQARSRWSSPYGWCWSAGVRIGEAGNPGPTSALDDPDADMWEEEFQPNDEQVDLYMPEDLHHDALMQDASMPAAMDEEHSTGDDGACGELNRVWNGDLAFSEEQLPAWQAAESAAGLSRGDATSTKRKKSLRPPGPPAANSAVDGFIGAKTFAGQLQHFEFKTGHLGTGYYDVRASAEPALDQLASRALSLEHLVPVHACNRSLLYNLDEDAETVVRRCKRARRARHRSGGRKVLVTRRQKAIRFAKCGDATVWTAPCTTNISDRSWMQQGLWAIDTANGNSWGTALRQVVERSQADILLLQETKLLDPQKFEAAKIAARSAGWNPTLSYAHQTCAARATGGNGVFARRGMGIHQNTDKLIRDGMRHRISLSWVDGVQRGGVHCGSIWLFDSQGLSDANMALLEEAAVALRPCQGGWIFGGDWNISAGLLAASKWLDMVGGVVFSTSLPTHKESTYDFFVVHRSLAHAVVRAQRIEDGGCTPH